MSLLAWAREEFRRPIVRGDGGADEPHDPEDEVAGAFGVQGCVTLASAQFVGAAAEGDVGGGDPEEGECGGDEEFDYDFFCGRGINTY